MVAYRARCQLLELQNKKEQWWLDLYLRLQGVVFFLNKIIFVSYRNTVYPCVFLSHIPKCAKIEYFAIQKQLQKSKNQIIPKNTGYKVLKYRNTDAIFKKKIQHFISTLILNYTKQTIMMLSILMTAFEMFYWKINIFSYNLKFGKMHFISRIIKITYNLF